MSCAKRTSPSRLICTAAAYLPDSGLFLLTSNFAASGLDRYHPLLLPFSKSAFTRETTVL